MRRLALVVALAAGACAPSPGIRAPSTAGWASPIERGHPLVGRIWDVKRRTFASEAALSGALARSPYVALGEQHDNVDHHLLEARFLREIVEHTRAPVVVFEMLDVDDQGAVLEAVATHPKDPDAIAKAVDWAHSGWPRWAMYRPVFDVAVAQRLTIVAGGVDRKAAMRIALQGPTGLPPELVRDFSLDRALPPRTADAMRAEMRDAHCGLLPESMLGAMVFVQRVRDATLADALVRAGPQRGGVLVAGNGHVRSDRGVPALVRARTNASFVSLGLLEVEKGRTRPSDYATAFGTSELPFDFVVFTPRATDVDHCAELRSK